MFRYGDRVRWRYIHHFNSNARAIREKRGEYWGLVRHTVKHKGPQLAYVLFDGNKKRSKVPVSELRAAQLCVETESGGTQVDHQDNGTATENENGK